MKAIADDRWWARWFERGGRSALPRQTAAARARSCGARGKAKPVVWTWQARSWRRAAKGCCAIKRKPGKPLFSPEIVQRVVDPSQSSAVMILR